MYPMDSRGRHQEYVPISTAEYKRSLHVNIESYLRNLWFEIGHNQPRLTVAYSQNFQHSILHIQVPRF